LLCSLLGLAAGLAPARALAVPCLGCKPNCKPIPPHDCSDCPAPCEHRLAITIYSSEHAQALIAHLCGHDGDCCSRTKAVKKLGHKLHADFCKDPCVLDALIDVLLFDSCWETRAAAAWAIYGQRAATEQGVLALYIAWNYDHHYLVRAAAGEALELLTLCRWCCWECVIEAGQNLLVELKDAKYRAGELDARKRFAVAQTAWLANKGGPRGKTAKEAAAEAKKAKAEPKKAPAPTVGLPKSRTPLSPGDPSPGFGAGVEGRPHRTR
jgi:hypothetical protein